MHKAFVYLAAGLWVPVLTACQVAPDKGTEQGSADTSVVQQVGSSSVMPTEGTVSAPIEKTASTTDVPAQGRTIAVNVQGTAPVGVTMRVKEIELGTDATVLNVSASYGGTISDDVALAGSQTYLLDEQGNKFMLKPPQGNTDLTIRVGQMMEGKLVFLGAVPPETKVLRFVINDGNDGSSIVDPGLTIQIPLSQNASSEKAG